MREMKDAKEIEFNDMLKGFEEEFGTIADEFTIIKLKLVNPELEINDKLEPSSLDVDHAYEFRIPGIIIKDESLELPGIYIFGYETGIKKKLVRIGRSLDNTLSRTRYVLRDFYHIQNENKGKMKNWYKQDQSCLYFFLLKNKVKIWWVKALESYFIKTIGSEIPSGRA